jgi:hypothetical protein
MVHSEEEEEYPSWPLLPLRGNVILARFTSHAFERLGLGAHTSPASRCWTSFPQPVLNSILTDVVGLRVDHFDSDFCSDALVTSGFGARILVIAHTGRRSWSGP